MRSKENQLAVPSTGFVQESRDKKTQPTVFLRSNTATKLQALLLVIYSCAPSGRFHSGPARSQRPCLHFSCRGTIRFIVITRSRCSAMNKHCCGSVTFWLHPLTDGRTHLGWHLLLHHFLPCFPKENRFLLDQRKWMCRSRIGPSKLLSKETQMYANIMVRTALENINLDCFKYK